MTVIERLSSNPNVDIDKIRQMLEMQERWEVNKDRSALSYAMAEFKKNPPEIIKKRTATINPTFSYSYADLENITSAIIGALAQYGVTHSWKIAEGEKGISVTCILRFGLYETDGVTLTSMPDTSGQKNAIQAKGSAISYLEKYTLLAATGMAAGMPDTDGNDEGPKMDGEAWNAHIKLIREAGTAEALKDFYLTAVKEARFNKDTVSEKKFAEAKDKRKAELDNAGH
jgi:hypothetical protein